jgi:RNA polymerase sigma-70 factor (ECF subfamily)
LEFMLPTQISQPLPVSGTHARLVELRPWLMKLAQARVRNRQMAQDAVADTLLAGLEAPIEIRDSDRLKPWLAGVLRNKVVDQLRQYGPRAMVVADDEAIQLADEQPQFGGDPMGAAVRKEFLRDLERALDELSVQQSRCFWLREIQDASTEAICAALGVTPQHAWVIAHRGRQRLKVLMAGWQPA